MTSRHSASGDDIAAGLLTDGATAAQPFLPASAAAEPHAEHSGPRLDVFATFIYVLLHLGCLGVVYTGVNGTAIAVLCGAYLIRAVGVSLVYHRYFAHRTFRTSRPMQFILGLYGTMTVLGGPLWWAQTHRDHHQHADTPEDIHSPYYKGFLYAHCGWFLDEKHRKVDLSKVRDLARFPELVGLEQWSNSLKLIYIALCYWLFGVLGIVWGFFIPTVITIQMVHWIQSVSHSIGGYRRYPTADDSRNHWLFGVVSLGEGYHHNHHCFPHSARLGLLWWEFDLGYVILSGLERLGLIWDVHVPSRGAILGQGAKFERSVAFARAELDVRARHVNEAVDEFERAGGDCSTAAVLRNRLSLRLAAYARTTKERLLEGLAARHRAEETLRHQLLADVDSLTARHAGQVDACVENIRTAISYRLEGPVAENRWRATRLQNIKRSHVTSGTA